MSKQRGIIMSAPMVLANLDKIKTETRRMGGLTLINENLDQNWQIKKSTSGYWFSAPGINTIHVKCPYGVTGDILYQRENLYLGNSQAWHYKADDITVKSDKRLQMYSWSNSRKQPYCPSVHMPKLAARSWFRIEDWSVERLRNISEESAWAEGCRRGEKTDNGGWFPADEPDKSGTHIIGWDCARDWYADLFCSLHGKDSWDANPYVWVIKYVHIDKPEW